jgi:hypothetical protein
MSTIIADEASSRWFNGPAEWPLIGSVADRRILAISACPPALWPS